MGNVKKVLLVILTASFLLSGGMLLRYFLRTRAEQKVFADLRAQTVQTTQVAPAADGGILPQYAALQAQNADLFGWLKIEGTAIDYPVMYTPDDPEYYLHRAFDGSDSMGGVLFVGAGYQADTNNTIVYGHNMKNGTMFADLLQYRTQAFWQAHPTVSFDTLYETGSYEVIAAFYSRLYATDETNVFRYYNDTNLPDAAAFDAYIASCRAAALYPTNVAAAYGDTLLTLSTCSYHTDEGRFVVVARKIE